MSMRQWISCVFAFTMLLCATSLSVAQSKDYSKFDLFGGYSWYHPGGSVNGAELDDYNGGWGMQLTYNLNHWAGLTLDASGHYHDGSAHSITGGPQFRLRRGHFSPFAEVLVGGMRFAPDAAPDEADFALITGGGIDYKINRHLSIRPIQADYVFTHYNAFTPSPDRNDLHGVRLQAGIVFHFGQVSEEEAPVSATCSAQPTAVDAGAPVQILVTPSGFSPKRTLHYAFTSTGVTVSGIGAGATVDTTGLQPGSYTVTATVTDNGTGTHQRQAMCQASFAINAMHPPTLTVSADPSFVNAGQSSAITANGHSPDNRPLTYQCSSNDGSLSGSGQNYTLDTTGVQGGAITVNCTVTDDRNQSASASTDVQVQIVPVIAPIIAPAAAPEANQFGAIEFKNDQKRPTRVDNEAKGELDRYADALANAPDATGVVVGYQLSSEPGNYAAQRAVNTKDYLTREKGIDPSRIEVRTGSGDDQRTDLWIVPAGATFSVEGTEQVNEGSVKAIPRNARARHRR
jgi:outer membrane protein OmpA-like peptidoglycan-associated protein